jgi:ABC-type bacteriocin/lantibiotic exporter with double-glycine peptidase domain
MAAPTAASHAFHSDDSSPESSHGAHVDSAYTSTHGKHGNDHDHPPHLDPRIRLLNLLLPEWKDIWVVAVFAIGIGILALSTPITVEALVSILQGGNRDMHQNVFVLALILLACLFVSGLMRAWQSYIVEYLQRRIFARVVGDLSERLPRVKSSALEGYHGPELVNRFFDVLTMQKSVATLLLDGLSVIIQAVIGMSVLALWNPFLLTYNIGLLALLVVLVWLLGYGGIRAKIRESYAKYAVAGWLQELIRHPHTFKPSEGRAYAGYRADDLIQEYLLARRQSFRILFRQVVFAIMMQAFGSSILLGLGGWLVIERQLTLGQLVGAELIVSVTIGSFIKLGKSIESFYDLMAATDKLGSLLDLETEREAGEETIRLNKPALIVADRLSFQYPDGRHSFQNVNLRIEAGERVALSGPAGSGKSTLIELLDLQLQPSTGAIQIDGVDLRDLSLDAARRRIAYAGPPEIFDGSIFDNVAVGRSYVTPTVVRAALARVRLLEEVQRLPEGLGTRLVTGGAPLSRSQADRLMLARAIAGNPGLLLVDNLLDGLEPDLRREVLDGLVDREAPWTLLIVSANPEVLAACGRVINPQGLQQ